MRAGETAVHWTIKEEDKLIELYKLRTSYEEILKRLTGRSFASIRGRINLLLARGVIQKRPEKVLKINKVNYTEKERPTKRNLERNTVKILLDNKCTGGFFGIPGPAFKEHVTVFRPTLREESPFIAVESNTGNFSKMSLDFKTFSAAERESVRLIKGDLFEVLKGIYVTSGEPRVPLFSYGHLDFTKSASGLTNETPLLDGLRWLAHWPQLKDLSFIDITVSMRPDKQDGITGFPTFLQNVVPYIFGVCGWKVTDPRCLKEKFIQRYQGAPGAGNMANALYKIERRTDKQVGRPKTKNRLSQMVQE